MITSPPRDRDETVRARMPADVDAPDRVFYGLTFRQLAILAVAAVIIYRAWHALDGVLPTPALLAAVGLSAASAFGLAVGRRDGLPLDVWLLAALRHHRAPKTLAAVPGSGQPPPPWLRPPKAPPRTVLPAPLHLPAEAVDADGQITLTGGTGAAVTACTGINLALATPAEQVSLVEAFGRWLNSLNAPTQIVVSAQPVDLVRIADQLAEGADTLPHPALRGACGDHAVFLADLARRRDPLRRQVLIAHRATGEAGGRSPATRAAEDTARALAGLGARARVLDAAAVTAALAACADPYRPARPHGLAAPDAVITGPTSPAMS